MDFVLEKHKLHNLVNQQAQICGFAYFIKSIIQSLIINQSFNLNLTRATLDIYKINNVVSLQLNYNLKLS